MPRGQTLQIRSVTNEAALNFIAMKSNEQEFKTLKKNISVFSRIPPGAKPERWETSIRCNSLWRKVDTR